MNCLTLLHFFRFWHLLFLYGFRYIWIGQIVSAFSIIGMANPGACKWGKNRIFVQEKLYF
jgi:hypothetical protein